MGDKGINMGYLFLMTFAGSALFVGFLCWEKVLKKSMTQCMKYGALLVVMLVYAVPWIWAKGIYRYFIESFWPGEVAAGTKGMVNVANIETQEFAYQTKEYKLSTLVVMTWFTIGTVLLIIRIVRYLMRRHALHTLAIKCSDGNLELTLKALRKTLRYRRSPEVVWTRVDNETFTLGVIRPVIFLQKEYAEGELYWILKHEMMHIVSMDLLVKLLAEFVCCLHWFNPLVYFLERQVKYLCETSCDERVIKGCTDEECEKYINLLEGNKNCSSLKVPFGSALQSNGGEMDKRIALMRGRRNIRCGEKVGTICVFAFFIFLDSLTALAYPNVHHVKDAVIETAEDAIDGNNFWIYNYVEDGYGAYADEVLYDEQFVGKDERIYPVTIVEAKEGCFEHDVVPGVVQIHKKDSQGCTLETYDGTRCSECGNMWKGDLLYITNKMPCPH